MDYSDVTKRLKDYAESRGLALVKRLGHGKDGEVWRTSSETAVKGLVERRAYFNEVSAYLRLYDLEKRSVEGFAVPRFVARDDELLVVEMSIVGRPCVLDFAGAGLDGPLHDFPSEVLEAEEERARELFGKRWPDVERVRAALRRIGIFISDLTPRNILFPEDE
jgi:hypothetical protein